MGVSARGQNLIEMHGVTHARAAIAVYIEAKSVPRGLYIPGTRYIFRAI